MTNTSSNPLQQISAAGVSIWLDDLSRGRIVSGNLRKLIDTRNVVGVTTNPTIFAAALAKGEQYAEQVAGLAAEGVGAEDAVFEITTDDVARASDVFAGVYGESKGEDGRVSIEVSPLLAHDTAATIAQAKQLWEKVDRPNAMIKIPATREGLPAITAVIAAGISVNVTLIFSLERYQDVIDAYEEGLEQAAAAGIDLSTIRSVASFFVSRVDTEVDKRLRAIGTSEALALTGKSAVANARLAYQLFAGSLQTPRWQKLATLGANVQRPLWASTGVKDPALDDTTYVVELVAPHIVNTVPEKTLAAVFDHGVIRGNTVEDGYADAQAVIDQIVAAGVDFDDVTTLLEKEGVEKFIVSWNELLEAVTTALNAANPVSAGR